MGITPTHVSLISIPKRGNTPDENEDAFFAPLRSDFNLEYPVKFAVADGATESAFAKEWADLLVVYYGNQSCNIETLPAMLSQATASWKERIGSVELPWYAQEKLQYGAYSSLLGVEFDLLNGSFTAMAIGDSNLFRVRGNHVLAFPITNSADFNNSPLLVSTKSHIESSFVENFKFETSTIEKDDIFILATDAISAWFLSESETSNSPWKTLLNLTPPSLSGYTEVDFNNWINNLRDEKRLKNDDTTLIVISF